MEIRPTRLTGDVGLAVRFLSSEDVISVGDTEHSDSTGSQPATPAEHPQPTSSLTEAFNACVRARGGGGGHLLGVDEDDEHEEEDEEGVGLVEVDVPDGLGDLRSAVTGKQTAQL